MVEVPVRQTDFSEQPFIKPVMYSTEERDLSNLKKKIGTARDFVIFLGAKNPHLFQTLNRSAFIKLI